MSPVRTFIFINVFQASFGISNITCCFILASSRTMNKAGFLAEAIHKFEKLLGSHSLIIVDCQTFLKKLA